MRTAPTIDFSGYLAPAPSGAAAPYATLRQMRRMVNAWKVAPVILQVVSSIIHLAPQKDEWSEAEALFEWVRDTIRYQRDPVGIEALATPLLTINRHVGDCDDQAALLATLFEAAGYPTRFVIAGYQSPAFEHVYLQVMLGDEWIDADPTEFHALGYAPPDPVVLDFEKV